MIMRQCPKGHFYDQEESQECPFCEAGRLIGQVRTLEPLIPATQPVMPVTQPVVPATQAAFPATQPVEPAQLPKTMPAADLEFPRTLPILSMVCGWLVCLDGSARGRDFAIRSGRNTVGYDRINDICLPRPGNVAFGSQAILIYDEPNRRFVLQTRSSDSKISVNALPLVTPTELAAYDRITIDGAELLFIPLCSDRFSW